MPLASSAGRTPSAPRLLRGADVADILAVTPRTVRALADRGELRRVKLSSRAVRYALADVEAFIAGRTAPLNEIDPAGNGADLSDSAGTGRHGEP